MFIYKWKKDLFILLKLPSKTFVWYIYITYKRLLQIKEKNLLLSHLLHNKLINTFLFLLLKIYFKLSADSSIKSINEANI